MKLRGYSLFYAGNNDLNDLEISGITSVTKIVRTNDLRNKREKKNSVFFFLLNNGQGTLFASVLKRIEIVFPCVETSKYPQRTQKSESPSKRNTLLCRRVFKKKKKAIEESSDFQQHHSVRTCFSER